MLYLYISFFLFLFHLFYFLMFCYFLNGGLIFSYKFLFFYGYSYEMMFVFDWISCGFSCFVMLISSVVFIYSSFYLEGDKTFRRFLFVLFLFVLSMLMLVFSPNLFSLMLGWDGLGLVSFLLVIYYNNYSSLNSGLLTVLTNRLGDLAMMTSFYFFFMSNSWNFTVFFSESNYLFGVLVILAASTKSAQLPFSSWLPAAMAAPTPVSSLVHSSTLVTAGVYLLIRFYYSLSSILGSSVFCFIALFTMFFSGVLAFFELDMKKVVAMSTLSQLGMMMFSISLGEWIFGFFHMVCHALFKALLFLSCGGFIFFSSGGQDLRQKGGYLFVSPFFCIMFVFSSLSLCGFPFLSGFYSKDLILESSFGVGWGIFSLMIFFSSCILSLVYSLRLFFYGIFFFNMISSSLVFSKKKLSLIFMNIMGVWSLFSGFILGSFLFLDSFFLVTYFFKFLGQLVILLGMVFFIFSLFVKFSYFSMSVLSDMFFMFWFSGNPLSKFSLNMSSFMSYDLLWVEFLGPSGIFSNLSEISLKVLKVEYILYKMIFVFVGLFFFMLILLGFF